MIGEFLGLFEVVGGEHDGGAVAGEIAHQFPAPPAGSGVESGGRLVEEENIGRADDAEREIDSSLLPPERREMRSSSLSASSTISMTSSMLRRRVYAVL